jgi:hypothetical protein
MVQAPPRGVEHCRAVHELDARMHARPLGVEVADGDDNALAELIPAALVVHEDTVADAKRLELGYVHTASQWTAPNSRPRALL